MDRFHILGPSRLAGRVRASGAKNAALPALAATLMAAAPVVLERVPRVRDIRTMLRLLAHLGIASEERGGSLELRRESPDGSPLDAPYELVKTMRASVLVLGPQLAWKGRARVSLPGGCAIGVRPIDQHLKGLAALGAEVRIEHGYVEATASRLSGARFRFDMPTVTGTENVMMAACLARGTTVLANCAREPEIADLAGLLNAMGARISGAGEESIVIEGVDGLGGATHAVISDRIEGGTYLIGAALTGGDVLLEGASPADLAPLLEILAAVGAAVTVTAEGIRVRSDGGLVSRDMETAPHPRFPTDLQAQYMALMTQADGVAAIRETIFENRFQHAPELSRMGADVRVDGGFARVHGPTPLSGASVMATDLRASACLVLAGVAAHGETTVERIYHLDRGYEGMELKLQGLGAQVSRLAEAPAA
ncbi:MAG TPA: UDP-N-acetylglucosamine 1-carboxyvinyltransferase [Thermoanaerobaculia bacterium]|nr:UDP-N-acetylglucosamine 1-carboxyvinyltransferase [Thermoanaerobaculia bacterium]